jgi:hypothetical protein
MRTSCPPSRCVADLGHFPRGVASSASGSGSKVPPGREVLANAKGKRVKFHERATGGVLGPDGCRARVDPRSPQESGTLARVLHKIPLESDNARAFVASVVIMGLLCLPKMVGKKTKPGHGLLDTEMPEAVRKQQVEASGRKW